MRIPVRLLCILCGWVFAAGCFRSDIREWSVDIPEAETEAERRAIAEAFLQKNDLMQEGVTMFYDIEVTDSGLRFTYHALLTARQNIVHFIAGLGYAAGDLPGDPDVRAFFREQHLSPTP